MESISHKFSFNNAKHHRMTTLPLFDDLLVFQKKFPLLSFLLWVQAFRGGGCSFFKSKHGRSLEVLEMQVRVRGKEGLAGAVGVSTSYARNSTEGG